MSALDVLQVETEVSAPKAASALLLTRIKGGNTYEETVERLLQTIRLGLIHSTAINCLRSANWPAC